MKAIEDLPVECKIGEPTIDGMYQIPHPWIDYYFIFVRFNTTDGWEHAMAYLKKLAEPDKSKKVVAVTRSLTWEETCLVKDLFWDPEECTVQFHPPMSHYVAPKHATNIWKPQSLPLPVPTAVLAALKAQEGGITTEAANDPPVT